MLRRLMRQGNTSLVVSLPIDWTRTKGLTGGNQVEVVCNKDRVMIFPKNELDYSKKHILNVEHMDELTLYINLLNLYRKGFDEIKIKSKSGEISDYETNKKIDIFASIRKWLPRFIGWEITKQDPIVIKDLTGESLSDPQKLLNRIFFLLNCFVDEGIAAANKKGSMPNPDEFYTTTFKLINFAIRTYNKQSGDLGNFLLLHHLHHIAQQLRDIQPFLKDNKTIITSVFKLLRPALNLSSKNQLSSFIEIHYKTGLKLNRLKLDNNLFRILLQLHRSFQELAYSTNFINLDI
jgi:hypothetical protein